MTYKEHLDQEFNRGWEAGNEHGIEQGKEQGIETGRVIARFEDGMPIEEIAKKCGITVETVKKILEEYKMI